MGFCCCQPIHFRLFQFKCGISLFFFFFFLSFLFYLIVVMRLSTSSQCREFYNNKDPVYMYTYTDAWCFRRWQFRGLVDFFFSFSIFGFVDVGFSFFLFQFTHSQGDKERVRLLFPHFISSAQCAFPSDHNSNQHGKDGCNWIEEWGGGEGEKRNRREVKRNESSTHEDN